MRVFFSPKFQAFDDNGDPLTGGKLYTYEAGTTTEKTTYSDVAGATPCANPIELDARGEAGPIYIDGNIKFVLKTAADVTIWTCDNIRGADWSTLESLTTAGSDLEAAVAAAGATETTILVNQAITLSDSLTVPANVHLWFIKAGVVTVPTTKTLTINGPLTAPAMQIFTCQGTGAVAFGDGYVAEVLPEWWGAKADASTDCTAAIQAAINSSVDGTVKLQRGTYMITTPLVQKASLIGAGAHGETIIKAKTGWAGNYMMDLYYGSATYKYFLRTENIKWDANSLVAAVFGSSSDGIGNSFGTYSNLWFTGSTGYAVNINTTATSAPGAITGATFINCYWNECTGAIWAGNNQDDVRLLNCRIISLSGSASTPVYVSGQNFTWDGGYLYIYDLTSIGGIKCAVRVTTARTTAFRNIFIETNDSDVTHIFMFASPQCNATLENIHLRVDDSAQSASLVALFFVQLESWADARRPQVHLKNIYADYDSPDWLLADVYVGSTAGSSDYLSLYVEGCDGFDWPLFQWNAGSSTVTRDSVYINGSHRGNKFHHAFRQAVGTTNTRAQTSYMGHVGIVTYNYTVDSASGASPRTATVTLPSEGQWLVSVAALNLNADKNQMASALYKVEFNDEATNDLLDSEILGTAQVTGSASTLTLGNPTNAGVCTATAEWTGGGSYMTRFVFRCRKLSNYTYDYDY